MQRRYISDLINLDDIGCWKPSNRILITAQTGSGKSEFIKNILYEHCKKIDGKVLLLSNRVLLREQIKEDLVEKQNENIITVINYQALEMRILNGKDLNSLFEPYDYIVYDEAHYIFADSQFNRSTDLLIEPIKNTPKDKIFIFITATPQALLDYQPRYDFSYSLPYNYSYIKDIYFYSKGDVEESIFQNLPSEEKAIYFASSAKNALDLSQKFISTSFICSEGNVLHDFSDSSVIGQIAKNAKFDSRFLFTTKVLDNGVNIKDDRVRHIIIDMLDPVAFLQCLGRKRILSPNDSIRLYIRNYHDGNLKYTLRGFESKLAIVQERRILSEEEFKEQYRKRDFDDVIDNDFRINMAKYQNYATQTRLLREMLMMGKDGDSYKRYICDLLNFDYSNIKDGNAAFEKRTLIDLLEEFKNKKMFKEDQSTFKRMFFDNIFSPKKTDYRHRGVRSINSIMVEDNLPYAIFSKRETGGERRMDYYWIVTGLDEMENNG
jgi:superfamily II DNA or RNA helicase